MYTLCIFKSLVYLIKGLMWKHDKRNNRSVIVLDCLVSLVALVKTLFYQTGKIAEKSGVVECIIVYIALHYRLWFTTKSHSSRETFFCCLGSLQEFPIFLLAHFMEFYLYVSCQLFYYLSFFLSHTNIFFSHKLVARYFSSLYSHVVCHVKSLPISHFSDW